jgi:hypothetical protein
MAHEQWPPEHWPYDETTLALVTQRLYGLLPAMYRIQDQPPQGREELRRFLEILAAPLAIVRQSIEELHADLFIDSSSDQAIPFLADMVATQLVFPDPGSNRRDVRGTVSWRRRKGTPAMLQEMAEELADQLVILAEGWQRVLVTQDLDFVRRERVLPDVRPPLLAETSNGPLDATYHAVDLRAGGQNHPRHVTHWLHPTRMFPVVHGTAAYVGDHGDPVASSEVTGTDEDWRYAVHPLGRYQPLRARRTHTRDPLRTDRVPAMHFDHAPGDWFGVDGRFAVRIAGLMAGVAAPVPEQREPQPFLADVAVLADAPEILVLAHETERLSASVEIALCAVDLAPGSTLPTTSGANVRAMVRIQASGLVHVPIEPGPLNPDTVAMLRLGPGPGVAGTYFPGATISITGSAAAARRAHPVVGLHQEGFLRGALAVTLPGMWLLGQHWLYLAADGSVASAQSASQAGSDTIDIALASVNGQLQIPAGAMLQAGPGPAWPPLPLTAETDRSDWLPPAPGCGPVILHGGHALHESAGTTTPVNAGAAVSLVFAAGYVDAGVLRYRPMVRLSWTGSEPTAASWQALDDDGISTPVDERFAELTAWRDGERPPRLRAAVRLESSLAGAILAPAEVAWRSREGEAMLIHLPELVATGSPEPDTWPSPPAYTAVSPAVAVAVDGSTWWEAGGRARMATSGRAGQPYYRGVAPIAHTLLHRRRLVRWRSLCPWSREVEAGPKHRGTDPGVLDIDVDHGLFALALDEPAQLMAPGPSGAPRPPNVTVDYQEGYTMHLGARPAAREPELDLLQPRPTRIVTRNGGLHRSTASLDPMPPRYRSLAEALAAIHAAPVDVHEVVQIDDSATYPGEAMVWPGGTALTKITTLTIQAAEQHRPVIQASTWANPHGASYAALLLRGLALDGAAMAAPPAAEVRIQFCSVLAPAASLSLAAPAVGAADVEVMRSLTAGLHLAGPGTLRIVASVVDAGAGAESSGFAITVPEGDLAIERATVIGTVATRELEASEVIFLDQVAVEDRFRGCIRFSAVPAGADLPRRHRTVEGIPPRFVSVDRHDPAHTRLSEHCDPALVFGAADGSEMGAFHAVQASGRREALIRRLEEYTPAGLVNGLVRVD